MRENCTYGSMRGRAYPTGESRSTLHSLCHEVVKNPFPRRFKSIVVWLGGAAEYVETTDEIIQRAKDFEAMGVKKMDALHLASAEAASCDWFFTTDRGILKKVGEVGGMRVANPVEFITWRADND